MANRKGVKRPIVPDTGPNAGGMHPVIARLRSGLRESQQADLDQLYSKAENNIDVVIGSVGFVTDLEKILFAMLLQLQEEVYLIREENKDGGF